MTINAFKYFDDWAILFSVVLFLNTLISLFNFKILATYLKKNNFEEGNLRRMYNNNNYEIHFRRQILFH